MNYSDMDKGGWDKPNDMIFKVIQGQSQGHRAFKLTKIAIFKVSFSPFVYVEFNKDNPTPARK